MTRKLKYEERILREIKGMPEEALPLIIRMISLIKEQIPVGNSCTEIYGESISHEKTRMKLSTSKRNWAHDIVADREDRI